MTYVLIALVCLLPLLLIYRIEGESAPAPAAVPAAAPPASSPPPAAAPSTPPPSSQAPPPAQTGSQAPPAAATPASQLRDQLNQHLGGLVNFSQYSDDTALMRGLAETLRQSQNMQQFATLGQQVMPHWSQFQEWQKAQEAAEQARRAQEQKWWNPPPFDRSWLDGVIVDEATGQLQPKPGYDPSIPQKIAAYRQFQREQLDKFFTDPIGMLKPGLEQLIKEIAGNVVQNNVGQYSATQQANDWVRQNQHWLFEHDDSKRMMYDQQGRPIPSQVNMMFRNHFQQILQMGIKDGPEAYELAKKLTHADLLNQAKAGTQTAAQPTPTAPAAPAAPGANRLQSLDTTAAANGTAIPRERKKPLGGRIQEALNAAGITDIPSPLGTR